MTEREVKKSKKDKDGDILALCNPGSWWSPRYKADAIKDIESKTYDYFVKDSFERKSYVEVVNGPTGKYLRTKADGKSSNNLDNIPDC